MLDEKYHKYQRRFLLLPVLAFVACVALASLVGWVVTVARP